GWLHVSSSGVTSAGVPLEILPAQQATACAFDAECGSGFCTDGVCCDARCDGKCEGCTAKRKTQGVDGVCGAVPPGRDIKGQCFALQGNTCKDAVECATGFCVEGVCCDSTCTGNCLSCTQAGRVGVCGAISEGSCDVACDGDHTLKKIGSPDVECAPFKCDGKQCRNSCASARDCVAPAVCSFAGQCVLPLEAAPANESVWGCAVGPTSEATRFPVWAAAFGVLASAGAVARRRRRRPR
ncbi:MAG: uncharacterized protein JWM74_1620, partial [Myxococcaceae bacterium]|nr:uncharacterized protein [Myxococcaceae bacterium]